MIALQELTCCYSIDLGDDISPLNLAAELWVFNTLYIELRLFSEPLNANIKTEPNSFATVFRLEPTVDVMQTVIEVNQLLRGFMQELWREAKYPSSWEAPEKSVEYEK